MKTIALTFDDAVIGQWTNVVPLLREYGFGATFFICRFDDAWRAKHAEHLLPGDTIKSISDAGFEIGNHTWSHCVPGQVPDDVFASEVDKMDEFLSRFGVPQCRSAAYPCGPFTPGAIEALKKRGYSAARTVAEPPYFRRGVTSLFEIPCRPVEHAETDQFRDAVDHTPDDGFCTLVFHGVPDIVHPWVDTPVAIFQKDMAYLRGGDFRVVSLADAVAAAGAVN